MRASRPSCVLLAAAVCFLSTACGSPPPQAETLAPTVTATVRSNTPVATLETRQAEEADAGCTHIGPSQLALMLEEKDFLLINTDAPYGFEIEQTDAHVPVDDEGRWLSRYPEDRSAKIVLYCRSGKWSTVAAEHLLAAGYTNVWHLDGGMVVWHTAGLPLVFD